MFLYVIQHVDRSEKEENMALLFSMWHFTKTYVSDLGNLGTKPDYFPINLYLESVRNNLQLRRIFFFLGYFFS